MATLATDCPHCGTQKVEFKLVFAHHPLGGPRYEHNCLAGCGNCGKPICFVATHSKGLDEPPQNQEASILPKFSIGKIWPSAPKAVAPRHAPGPIANRFLDGEDAYSRKRWNGAVAMYRSSLDIATKEMVPEAAGKLLHARLQWMLDNGKLTQDLWEWANHVRLGGNDAIHDPDEFAEADAAPLRFFTEMFLRYVYELPGEVARLRAESEPKAKS